MKSVCRYFGESIDASDEKIMKKYCNGMCDVCYQPLLQVKNSYKAEYVVSYVNIPIKQDVDEKL